ncbi:hypothetical protein BDZ94DRAFT_296829 [Collybia nuda]|uniref:Uncharacterized protein n=1 Tax=Collybia nuda TaxID=64659 RepID=A0A9P5YBK2_9AGAR|nr:hypothetical protein BDZ94DRAFT_296829 [Collybia nuda]
MEPYSADLATMVALFLGSVAYGINLLSLAACLEAMYMGRSLGIVRRIHYVMLSIALIMFCIATFDIGVMLDNNLEIFVEHNPDAIPSPVALSNWWSMAVFCSFIAQAFLGDAVLIYRAYIIWDRRWWLIVLPIITWLGATACGIGGVTVGAKTFHSTEHADIAPFVTALVAQTFATNFVTSSLIIGFFWNAHKKISAHNAQQQTSDPLTKITEAGVESGVLYTSSMLLLLIIYAAGSHTSQIPMSRIIVQVIAITFNLIITVGMRQEERFRVSVKRSLSQTEPSNVSPVALSADNPSTHTRSHVTRSDSSDSFDRSFGTKSERTLKDYRGSIHVPVRREI